MNGWSGEQRESQDNDSETQHEGENKTASSENENVTEQQINPDQLFLFWANLMHAKIISHTHGGCNAHSALISVIVL